MRRLSWALGAVSLAVMAGLGLLTPAAAQAPGPDTTTTTAPDPNAVATRAAAAWSPPEPRIRTNPPPERAQVAGLATWLWVEPPGPLRFGASDGPTTVALEARAREVRFELGDGTTLTCPGTGTPYDASRPESAQSSQCTHAWEATSGGETLEVRATVTWAIFFEGRPVGTEAASSDLDVAVAEAQALDRRPDPMSGAEGDAGADADADSGGRPLGELGELVPEEDKGCGRLDLGCWAGKGLNALGDLAGGALDVAKQVGGFFVGVVKGFGGLVAELFTIARGLTKLAGIYDLVDWVGPGDGAFDEFKDTWGGLWDGVKTVFTTNPLTTGKGIWEGVWGPIRDAWKSGDYGEAIGRGAFDIAAAIVGTKGLSKAGKLKGAKTPDAPKTAPKPLPVGSGRLPQDINVNPKPPDPLPTNRPVGKNPIQNQAVQDRIRELQALEADDIRVNQQQVNADGVRVGTNRPDLQYTLDGKRYYEEYDLPSSDRGEPHKTRIEANDPDGEVILHTVPQRVP